MHIYLRHSRCSHHHNTRAPENSFFAQLTLIICRMIIWVGLAWLPAEDIAKKKRIYSKIYFAAYTNKLASSFLYRNIYRDGCYAGDILGVKTWKLAQLRQIRSRSKLQTLVLNQTNKPCEEDYTITWTFKPQTGTFVLLCLVVPAGEHCLPLLCLPNSLYPTIFWEMLWCPSVP